jgi:DNA-binding CsgD family transcriptional regulator
MKGHSEKEIAGILKIQAGTVASRWYRIMEKIKNKI